MRGRSVNVCFMRFNFAVFALLVAEILSGSVDLSGIILKEFSAPRKRFAFALSRRESSTPLCSVTLYRRIAENSCAVGQ